LRLDFTVHNTVRSLVEETSRVVPWDYVSAVVYDESRKAWVLQHVLNRMNDPYVPAGQEIDLHRSLAGQVIQYSVPKIVEHLASVNMPRFYPAERSETAGSLVALPLTSVHRCYGVLVVESKDVRTYSESDARLIQKLADTASWALEILSLTDVATNYVATDEVTGVATRRHFVERMQEEVQRAADFGSEVAMVMIAIDNLQTLAGKYSAEAVDAVLQTIGRLIRTAVRPYDVVGRFDTNRFAAVLIETTTNEASLWAEKLRKNVAGHIVNVGGKSFSVTISVGVCGASTELSDMVLLENADRVLKKAVEAGGNIVRVF
jgi:diguanylate cyclase (GGDEF)-like protein